MKMRNLPKNLNLKKKSFEKVKFWKINLFNLKSNKHYDAVISYEDLIGYYESEIFAFLERNPNINQPNLITLLHDYIRNIYIYRTKVGFIPYWRIP
jgi:hypothetical protein